MADRDRAAVDVQLLVGDAELVAAIKHLHGEGLVQLPQVDVVHLEPEALQQLGDRIDRTDAHLVGLAAGHDQSLVDAERLQAPLGGFGVAHDHRGRGAVGELARIAGGDPLVGPHHRLQLGEAFLVRVGTVAFVLGELHRLLRHLVGVLVGDQHRGLHRHDLVVELAGLLGRRRAELALQRILVLVLAADVVAARHRVGGGDHGVVDTGHVLLHPGIDQAVLVAARGALHQGDRFEAARDHHRHLVDQHALGRHRDGLQARGAEAVDRDARNADRRAGADRRNAGHVGALRALRRRAAQDHVLDLTQLELGALGGVLDDVGAHVGGMGVVEGAAEGLADRRAGG